MLVEVRHCLGVMGLELGLGDLVNPGSYHLAEDLAARFASNRVGDHPDGVLRFYEAERHRSSGSGIRTGGTVGQGSDGACGRSRRPATHRVSTSYDAEIQSPRASRMLSRAVGSG